MVRISSCCSWSVSHFAEGVLVGSVFSRMLAVILDTVQRRKGFYGIYLGMKTVVVNVHNSRRLLPVSLLVIPSSERRESRPEEHP